MIGGAVAIRMEPSRGRAATAIAPSGWKRGWGKRGAHSLSACERNLALIAADPSTRRDLRRASLAQDDNS